MDHAKHIIDFAVISTVFSSVIGLITLPHIATLLSILWLTMQMVINWDKFISATKAKIRRWFK